MLTNWNDLIKQMKLNLKRKETFKEGINNLLSLRNKLFEIVSKTFDSFPIEGFSRQPFINAKGYESKTMIYSIYHITRIEDIVCNFLIQRKEEIFFEKGYDKKTNSNIITTGNELIKEEIALFSSKLNVHEVINYFKDVYEIDNEYISKLTYEDLKKSFTDEDKKRIFEKKVVSNSENSIWLIDYWCNKNVLGLLEMPFSRHWVMHIEAFSKIKDKLIAISKRKEKQIKA